MAKSWVAAKNDFLQSLKKKKSKIKFKNKKKENKQTNRKKGNKKNATTK